MDAFGIVHACTDSGSGQIILQGIPQRSTHHVEVEDVFGPVRRDGQCQVSEQPVTATIDQWRIIAQSLNGQRASVTADMIIDLLTERGMTAPSDSTVRRWARMTVNGEL